MIVDHRTYRIKAGHTQTHLKIYEQYGFAAQTRHLRSKLQVNAQKVAAHLEAVRSVVDLLKTAAQDADADGIYTEAQFRYSDF